MGHVIPFAAFYGAKSRFYRAAVARHARAEEDSKGARPKGAEIHACHWTVLLGCTCALLTAPFPGALAGPVGFQSIPDLCDRAAAIVVASVQATAGNGIVSAMINPEQVLKGPMTPGNLVAITWASP